MPFCAVVAASEFNAPLFQCLADAGNFSQVIAVDGGHAHLLALGIEPDMSIGDFDSLGFVPEQGNVKAFPKDKDTSDLELALQQAFDAGEREFVIFGALGGRLDHTLVNIALFGAFADQGARIMVMGMQEQMAIVKGQASIVVEGSPGAVFSLISLTDECTGVYELGSKWELDNVVLKRGTTLGLSNEVGKAGDQVIVTATEGVMAVITGIENDLAIVRLLMEDDADC